MRKENEKGEWMPNGKVKMQEKMIEGRVTKRATARRQRKKRQKEKIRNPHCTKTWLLLLRRGEKQILNAREGRF